MASLNYKSWFSFAAELRLINGNTYQLVPKSAWGTAAQLIKNKNVVLSVKMHWNGNIIIKSFLDGNERDFVFKSKRVFKSD